MPAAKIRPGNLLLTVISVGILTFGFLLVLAPSNTSHTEIAAPVPMENDEDYSGASASRITFPTPDDWPSYLRDYHHTSYTTSDVPETNKTLWTYPGGSDYIATYSSPIIVYESVFITGMDDKVYSLDIKDGSKNWDFTTDNPFYSSPTYHNGFIYFGNSNGWVYSLYANNGTKNWERKVPASLHSSPLLVGDHMYFGCRDDYFYCLNATTGTINWKYDINDTSISPAYDNGKVYIASYDHKLFVFDDASGTHDFNVTFENSKHFEEFSSPLIVGDYIYIGTDREGWLYCLWKTNGTVKWKDHIGPTCSSPSYGYGHIFISNDVGQIFKFTPDGTEVWNVSLSGSLEPYKGLWNAVSIADGKLLATHDNGSIYCINATDHSIEWKYDTLQHVDYICSAPAIAYGVVVTVLGDGKVYCFGNYTAPDYTPPQVSSTSPSNGQTGVGVSANITVTFSEQMTPLSFTSATLYLKNATMSNVTGAVSYSVAGKTATFDPDLPLNYSTTYTVTVISSVTDLAGLSLDGDKDGVAEGAGIDDVVFSFTTQAANAPGISTIPIQHPIEDTVLDLDLSYYITDSDTPLDQLTITENSTYVEIVGHNLTFLYPEGVLTDLVNLTVSDATSMAFQVIVVEVVPVNDPPVMASIPSIDLNEDQPYLLNLSAYVSDVDTPFKGLSFSSNASASKLSAVFEGTNLTLTYIKQNGPLPQDGAVLNISVFDQMSYRYTDVALDLIPVNDPPTIGQIDPVTVTTGIPLDIPLSGLVNDVDDQVSELTLSEDSDYVTVNGLVLTLLYTEMSPGSQDVNVSVTDGALSAWTTLSVTIVPGNVAPALADPLVEPSGGDETTLFKFTVTYTDTDAYEGNLSFSEQAGHAAVYLVLNGTDYKMELASGDLKTGAVFEFERGFAAGTYTYNFKADDLSGSGNSAANTDEETLTVAKANINPEDNGKNGGTIFSGASLFLTISGVVALVIIAVLVVVLIVVVRRKNTEQRPPEPQPAPAAQPAPPTEQAAPGPEGTANPPLQQTPDAAAPPVQQGPEPASPSPAQQAPASDQAPDLQPPQAPQAPPSGPTAAPAKAQAPGSK